MVRNTSEVKAKKRRSEWQLVCLAYYCKRLFNLIGNNHGIKSN